MSWRDPVDLYCERLDAGLLAEPMNALTNAAFLVAAALAWSKLRAGAGRDRAAEVLTGLAALIGLGSFLFHTLAVRAAALADTLPITAFILVYLLLALRRFLQFDAATAIGATVAYAVVSALAGRAGAGVLNGSVAYLPALAALAAIAGLAAARHGPNAPPARDLLLAAPLFAISLAFRTIDLAVCDAWPLGTHALWHVLNAVVLFLLLRAAIETGPAGRSR